MTLAIRSIRSQNPLSALLLAPTPRRLLIFRNQPQRPRHPIRRSLAELLVVTPCRLGEQQRVIEAPRPRIGDGDVFAGLRCVVEIARLLMVADRLAIVNDSLIGLPCTAVNNTKL